LRDLITKYQLYGDREIIDYILSLVEIDMLPFRSVDKNKNIHVELDEPLKYVAYRIKSMTELMTKKARSLKAGNKENRDALLEFADGLSDEDWLGIDYEAVYKGDYSSITGNWDEIFSYLGATQGTELKLLLELFEELKITVDEGKQNIRNNLQPIIVEALEYAILYVDVKRTEKEIVKYLNRVWLTRFILLQVELNGLVRVQRSGKVSYLKPIFNEIEVDIWELLFNKTLKYVEGIKSFNKYLNKNQIALVENLYLLIAKDLKRNNYKNYYFGLDGKPILNKRYIAEMLGLSESNFKHKLLRIQKKINENFKTVVMDKVNNSEN
jgi:hypothetical protein